MPPLWLAAGWGMAKISVRLDGSAAYRSGNARKRTTRTVPCRSV